MSIILAYKYVPTKIPLTAYLFDLYHEMYQYEKDDQYYSQYAVGGEECLKNSITRAMENNITLLKEKYKGYLIEKDITLEEDNSELSNVSQPK
jgi:hypothetical protein